MADLPYIKQAQEVKITGQDSVGTTVNFVGADSNGNLLVKEYSSGPVTPGTVASNSSLMGGQYNTSLPSLSTTQQAAIQLDSSGRIIIRPLTSADVVSAAQSGNWSVRLQDGSGNVINSNSNQLQVRDVINTAGQNRAQSVTTSAAEALGAATILANRKFLNLCPTNGTIYWGFANTVTTSSGTPIFKNQMVTIAVTDNVHIYVIAGSTVDCRMAEGS